LPRRREHLQQRPAQVPLLILSFRSGGCGSLIGRGGIKDDVTFKDLRSLGATDAAKAGQQMKDIQKCLVHPSSKTSEIYIKEAAPSCRRST
jgi:hypothetical protein